MSEPSRRPRPVAVLGAVAVALALVLVFAAQHHHHAARHTTVGGNNGDIGRAIISTPPRAASIPAVLPPHELSAAEKTASAYVAIAHSQTYTDSDLSAWVTREKPYVTSAYYSRLRSRLPMPDHTSAADARYLAQLRSQQEHIDVTVDSVTALPGGRTRTAPDRLPLYVYYQLSTYDLSSPDGYTGPQIPTTIDMQQQRGRWLVTSASGA